MRRYSLFGTVCLLFVPVLVLSTQAQEKDKPAVRRIPVTDLKIHPTGKDEGPLKPTLIASADELAKSPLLKDAAEALKKQIDFSREKLVVFAWTGQPKEVVGPVMTMGEVKKSSVHFLFTRAGATKGSVFHLHLYAVPKSADVSVEVNPKSPK